MESKSKKDGKIFTGKFASLAVKIGLAVPIEEADKPVVKKSAVTKRPVKKQVMKVKK